MNNVTTYKISYSDIKQKAIPKFNDPHRILSGYLIPNVINTLLANPSLSDNAMPAINVILCDNTIVGRNMMMPTLLRVHDEQFVVQTGGSYEVGEQYRGNGYGRLAFYDTILGGGQNDVYIGQLYSTAAISIIKKMGLIVFQLPCYYKLCKSRPLLETKGINGLLLKPTEKIVDNVIKLLDRRNRQKLKKLKLKYTIKKERIVPQWVEDLTLNDGHMFREVHDCKWLQWCLDYRFTDIPEDSQSFYSIYDSNGMPQGFFMTKIRFEAEQGAYKNTTKGTIVEWGSYNETDLSEADINFLAVDSFQNKVDSITTVLSNPYFDKALKKMGFLRHGNYQMSIKSGSINNKEIAIQDNWRIRYGGCNTIIF